MKSLVAIMTVALMVGAASAAVLENFESGWVGDGDIVADPAGGAGSVLFLNSETSAPEVARIVLPTSGAGVLTVDVYDPGLISDNGDTQGPRWGIAGTDPLNNACCAALMDKSWLASEAGYAWNGAKAGADLLENGPTSVWNWFSPDFFGGPRQSNAWTTWTFTVDENDYVTVSAFGKTSTTQYAMPGGGVEFIACGGSASTNTGRQAMNGIYLDNVTWVPEPATMSLLALGGLGLIRRRRA